MRQSCRYWISLAMVAAIVIGSGITGYAAYPPHDVDNSLAHALGSQIDHHHHDGDLNQAHALHYDIYDIDALCDDESCDKAGHIHTCCGSVVAVQPSNAGLNFAAPADDILVRLELPPLIKDLSYLLLRPPIAIA
jgi:hypothetical protein